MAVIGQLPESGVRLAVERPREGGPPWIYAGEALTKDGRFAVRAVVGASGEVELTLEAAADGLAAKVRLLLRTAYRHAQAEAGAPAAAPVPPPRRIVRWRPDR